MSYYGIKENELAWFKSYLEDRVQIVSCNNKKSNKSKVNIGVPQGSILGPLLFSLFVNDLSQFVYLGTANLYADDTLIYCTGETIDVINEKLQTCINDVSRWYTGNRLILNANKSNVILIGSTYMLDNGQNEMDIKIDDYKLEQTNSIEYLGVKIDNRVSWNAHMEKLTKSLYYKVSKLARLKKCMPIFFVKQMYDSIIQPSLDYAITVWGSTTDQNINRIQRIQNYAARIVTGNFDYINVRGIDLVHSLGWMNVKQRCNYFRNILMYKCLNNLAPVYLSDNIVLNRDISIRDTRNSSNMSVHVPFIDKKIAEYKFSYSGPVCWNVLPEEIQNSDNINNFKANLKNYVKRSIV
jgi:hypothetical protein